MNEKTLSALLEQTVHDVTAEPTVAAVAWERARQQSRRAQIATVSAAGLAALVATLLVAMPDTEQRSTPPVTSPTSPTTQQTSVSISPQPTTARGYLRQLIAVMQEPWNNAAFETLPLLETALPATLSPGDPDAPSLSEDPVTAVVAVATSWKLGYTDLDVRVLGDDQRWRRLDLPGVSTGRSVLGPISPDGTKLVLTRPDALDVVDLTTGLSRRFDIPGFSLRAGDDIASQWTPDGRQVVVSLKRLVQWNPSPGWLVDVSTGETGKVPYDAAVSAFSPDGRVVQIDGGRECAFCELKTYRDDELVDQVRLNTGLLVNAAPVIDEALVVVSRPVASDVGVLSHPKNKPGLLVLDPDTHEPRAFLPVPGPGWHNAEDVDLHGWLDEDTVVFSTTEYVDRGDRFVGHELFVAWNYRTGSLSRLSEDPYDDFDVSLVVQRL